MKTFVRILVLALAAALLAAVLVSCAPAKDPDKAVAALKEEEYTVLKDSTVAPAALTLFGVKGVDCVVTAGKTVENKDGEKTNEAVLIVYFTDAGSAKDALDKVKAYYENEKDAKEEWKQSGKMVYSGTAAGIKAAR